MQGLVADVHQTDQPAGVTSHGKRLAQHQQAALLQVYAFALHGLVQWRRLLAAPQRLQAATFYRPLQQFGDGLQLLQRTLQLLGIAVGRPVGQHDLPLAVADHGGRWQLQQGVGHKLMQLAQLLRSLLHGQNAALQKVASPRHSGRRCVQPLHAQMLHFLVQKLGRGTEPAPAP